MIPIDEPSRHTVPAQERIEILDRISRAITQAERSTMDLTGGQAVCQLHKDGRVTGGVKYREGRLVALYNLRRRVAVLEDGELARASDEVRDECATWQEIIDRQRNTERPSVSWLAYGQGGMDACQEIMQQLP
jgi:hypothetical protein